MRHRTLLLLGIVVVVVAGILSAGLFVLSRIPSVENQILPGSSPVHVRLSAPGSPAGWPLNAYIPVQAEAAGSSTVTGLELYINGELYERVQPPAGWDQHEYAALWRWQPGEAGAYILTARAFSEGGGTGLSEPIRMDVTAASGGVSPHVVVEGESLASIAESSGADLAEMAAENLALSDPQAPLQTGSTVYVPNPPDPVSGPRLIPALHLPDLAVVPGGEGEETSPPANDSEEEILQPVNVDAETPQPISQDEPAPEELQANPLPKLHIPSLQDIQLWLGGAQAVEAADPPKEPFIKAYFKGCDVTIQLLNTSAYHDASVPEAEKNSRENGFFLYRSLDGGDFERLATLPAITSSSTWEYLQGYVLKDQYGAATYALAAFNAGGETMSAPALLPLDQANCTGGQERLGGLGGKIRLEDGDLVLPFSMDVAYLYLSINETRARRIPEGDRMFLPDSGVRLNLYDYFNTLLGSFIAADFEITMEVWGWAGGRLKYVGSYNAAIHRSILLVCSEEGEGKCSGKGDGQWLPEINFSTQKPVKDQVYEFKWISSQISKTKDVCIQFSAGGFPSDDFWTMDLPISSGCMEYIQGNEGTFTMPMGILLYPTEPPEFIGWGAGSQLFDYNSNWFQNDYKEGSSFTLYARTYPRLEVSGFNRYSNTLVMHRNTPPAPSDLPPLASPNPSLYEVEILRDTYIPPTFETEAMWGCVVIDEDPSNPANVGKTVCPPPITAKDDCAGMSEAECLLKGTGNAILFIVDHFVYAIKMIKWEMTEAITYTIPYCHDYGPCYKVIEETVEQIIYYGIGYPPHTDTSEDLIAGWIGSYMLSSASDYTKDIGFDEETLKTLCGDDCQEKIGLQVIQMIRQKKSMESQNACVNAYQAYFHNKEAMCLDPSIIVHPAEGSGYYPAGVTIKITRKELPPGQSPPPGTIDAYQIRVTGTGANDTTVYGPGYTAQIYAPVTLPVYILDPGESMVLNTKLIPCSTYGAGSCVGADGWKGMKNVYYNGTTTLEAVELCHSPDSSVEWVPCTEGGYDRWEFENPKTPVGEQP